MKKIAFATCEKYPQLTEDDRLVMEPLRHLGIEVSPLIWDSADSQSQNLGSTVIRSCWDYHFRPRQFLRWIKQMERRGAALWNPARVVEWNL